MRYKVILSILLVGTLWLCSGCHVKKRFLKLTPQELYNIGNRFYEKEKLDKAIDHFSKIQIEYPGSEIAPDAIIANGKAYYDKKEYVDAAIEFISFIEFYPADPRIVEVHYRLGKAYSKQMLSFDRDQTLTYKCMAQFQNVLNKAPHSEWAEESREEINKCQQKLAFHEFYVGRFYYRMEHYEASLRRLEGLLNRYPFFDDKEKAYYVLTKCLLKLKKPESAEVYVRLLEDEYPRSKLTQRAMKLVKER